MSEETVTLYRVYKPYARPAKMYTVQAYEKANTYALKSRGLPWEGKQQLHKNDPLVCLTPEAAIQQYKDNQLQGIEYAEAAIANARAELAALAELEKQLETGEKL